MLPVIVSDYTQLCAALDSGAAHILCKDFALGDEGRTKVVLTYPVTIDGAGHTVDFGFEIRSGGVTLRDLHIHTRDFDHAVSAAGKNGRPGDCLAIEIRSTETNPDLPVTIEGCTILHEVLDNMNSAIYISDGCRVEIHGNNITVEDKMANKALERGGIFVGQGVGGHICGNRIHTARTGFPITPYGLRASLDHMTGPVALPPVEIRDNTITATYFAKLYVSGAFFSDDGLLKEEEEDFGARSQLRDYILALWRDNTFTHISGMPALHEGPLVQPRLDRIAAGAPYHERYVFFELHDGCPVRIAPPKA